MLELSEPKYQGILKETNHILEQGRARAEESVKKIAAQTYWDIGALLVKNSLESSSQATLNQLAEDTRLETTQLIRFIQFYNTFPQKCPIDDFEHLTWSHFKLILPLSPERREYYLNTSEKNQWPVRTLSQHIKDDYFEQTHSQEPDSSGTPQLKRRDNKLHIYKAEVAHIVDGDTIVVNIDLGFDVWVKKRIRLRGINCAETASDDPVAQKALVFVHERIPVATVIVVQTFMVDLHGRFVADVFYLPGEKDKEVIFQDGQFLNQELLDEGLADLM